VNTDLFDQINQFAKATGWLQPIMTGYANYGIVLFAGLLVAGWWTARRSGDPRSMAVALLAGASTLLAVAVNQPLVALVHEPRPYTTHPGILVLAQRSTDWSFPSDHATMAGAAAAGLWFLSRRLGVTATVAALLMGFARVYIAAHYPADVLAGLALGAVVAAVVCLLVRRVSTRLVVAVARTRFQPLVAAPAPGTP
jgi:membrane-associated phospholipid phosphatase